jgi:hypothetical protein
MVSKILSLLLNVLMNGSIMTPETADRGFFANLNLASLRRVLLIATGIAASLIFFLGGIFTILLDLVLTSRDAHGIYLSQTSMVGVGLIVISILSMLFFSSRRLWSIPTELVRQQQAASLATPILDAVVSLIGDFAEDRRMEREIRAQALAGHRAAEAHAQAEALARAQAEAQSQAVTQANVMENLDPYSSASRPAFN